jgi:hypothetical protein
MAAPPPATAPAGTFQLHRGDLDFREGAAANPAGCLRKLRIKRAEQQPPPTSSDLATRQRIAQLEIVIAYPRLWARVSGADQPDLGPMEDVIEEDQRQLDSRDGIGLDAYGSNVAGHWSTRITWSIEEVGKVLLSVGKAEVLYYEEV